MVQSPITRAWNKKFEGKRKSKKVKDEGRKPYSESATGDKRGGALERPSRVTAIALSLRHHISATREPWKLEVNIQDPSLLPFGWPIQVFYHLVGPIGGYHFDTQISLS